MIKGFNIDAGTVKGFKKAFGNEPEGKMGSFILGFKTEGVDAIVADDGFGEEKVVLQAGRNVVRRYITSGKPYTPQKHPEFFVEPKNFVLMMKERQNALDTIVADGYK